MMHYGAKFIIFASLIFNVLPVNAAIYRIDLTYDSDTDGGPGSLSGFIEINSNLLDGTENNTNTSTVFNTVPDWISTVELTISGRTGLEAAANGLYTKSDFDRMAFTIKDDGNDFNLSTNFKTQMVRFGFDTSDGIFGLPSTIAPFDQEAAGGEFPLTSSTTTPGELPLLGLGTLIYYSRKFKKKNFKF